MSALNKKGSDPFLIRGTEVKIIQSDITSLEVDAIVNAANNKLVMGGGVAGAIKRKGGKAIEDEAVKKGPIRIGEAVATGAGSLKAKYVIHAAAMGMDFETDEAKIRESCRSALKIADELKVSSIAFPALGCGIGGFGLLAAAKIMSQEVFKYLRERRKAGLKEIVFCLYDAEAFEIFDKQVPAYLTHITEKLQKGPFITVDALIEMDGGIVLIKRKNPPFGWALPGGFVDYGESLEDAVIREAKEETGLDLIDVKQFRAYSDPARDARFHTISMVFTAKGKGRPQAADDAADLKIVKLNEAEGMALAFDHRKVIADYISPSPVAGVGQVLHTRETRTKFGGNMRELKKALETALDMEGAGYDFYKKCAKKTKDELAKKVFEALAEDENRHIGSISCYCAGVADKNKTPRLCDVLDPHKPIKQRVIFEKFKAPGEAADDELKAYETAMKMENDGYDFYKKSYDAAGDGNSKDLYKFLMGEEKAHFELINNTYNFLKDPAGWYIQNEKPIVEG